MARERTADFLLDWLHTVDSLGFIICVIVLAIALYHVYLAPNVDSVSASKKRHRGYNHKLNPKTKWLSILSIIFFTLAPITSILNKEAQIAEKPKLEHAWFVLTQFFFAFGTITSHLLFIAQLYIVYNSKSNIHQISPFMYIILLSMIGIFAIFMFTKSILIVFLDEEIIKPDQYGKIGAITVYASSLSDLIITISMLYLFNSRLTKTIKGVESDSIENKTQQTLINVRLKLTILTFFGVISSQLYLIIWSTTVLLWYNYQGNNKDIYMYDFTITTITIRIIACVTNAIVILMNFKFGGPYFRYCCHPILYCCWGVNRCSGHEIPRPGRPRLHLSVVSNSKTITTSTKIENEMADTIKHSEKEMETSVQSENYAAATNL